MRSAILLAAALLCAQAATLHAQERDDTMVLQRPVRGWVGGNVYYAHPVGDFANFIDHGWGGEVHGTLLLDRAGALGLRFDASFMNYGRERVNDVCALPTICRVLVDVVTTNNIAFVGAGPQLMAPSGVIRPYVAGQAGWTFIWTNSSIEDSDDDDETALDTQNLSDNTFSYGGAAGFLVPISAGRTPVALDFGARYLRNGDVRYLRKGDIIDNPSGLPYLNIQRSRADLVTYYLGVSIGVR